MKNINLSTEQFKKLKINLNLFQPNEEIRFWYNGEIVLVKKIINNKLIN